METKKEILERLGKKDGKDNARWQLAVDLAGRLDRHVNFCLEGVINLEEKGLVELKQADAIT